MYINYFAIIALKDSLPFLPTFPPRVFKIALHKFKGPSVVFGKWILFCCLISHFLHQVPRLSTAGRTSSFYAYIMHQHAAGDEVGVEVLDVEVVDGDGGVQLLQPQSRHNPRVAGERLDRVPNHQVARCNPAPAHDVERMAGRGVNVIAAKLDVQQLAGLDLYISV